MTKVFIATANQDKFMRMARWFVDLDVELLNPNDLAADLARQTKVTDSEEQEFGSMTERALGKAAKASRALRDQPYLIVAMDDTAYLPLLDSEVNDLRTPPAMYIGSKLILPAVTQRLSGADLANHYAKLTDIAISEPTEQMRNLGYKFMPIVWRFAVAIVDNRKSSQPQVIANWERKQYLRNTLLTGIISDTGYMMDRIISTEPDGPVQVYGKGLGVEQVPVDAFSSYLAKFA